MLRALALEDSSLVFSFWARLSLVLVLALVSVLSTRPAVSSADNSVDIVVKNWSFTPSSVEVHVGKPAVLRFTDSEGVHGVESADLGIPKTTIVPGKVTEVSFTPKTAGTFPVHCAVVCGEGHDKMLLTVNVVP
jgi:heme/copper-type cytochrome/quinol oxidase subunit 2